MTAGIDAEELYAVVEIREIVVSPAGSEIAFVTAEFEERKECARSSLFLVPADGSSKPYRLSRVSDVRSPKWSPDGMQLAVLATREPDVEKRVNAQDAQDVNAEPDAESSESQVWVFDLERGGDARQVTDREHGVREFDWGPRGERLVIAARDPTAEQAEALEQRESGGPIEIEHLPHKADGIGYTDGVKTRLFIVNVQTGSERGLDDAIGRGASEPHRGLQPAWHPRSEVIAFLTNRSKCPQASLAADVCLVHVESGEIEQVTGGEYIHVGPTWSPSGNRLVFTGRNSENWHAPAKVFLYDHTSTEIRVINQGMEATVAWFDMPQFIDEDTILGAFGASGSTRFYRLSALESDYRPFDIDLGSDQSLRHFDVKNDTLAFSLTDPTIGHELFTRRLGDVASEGATPQRLTTLNESLLEAIPTPGFARISSSHEDATIESMCYYPDSFDPEDPQPHPMILSIHGGPTEYVDPGFDFNSAYYASHGYVVCKPNFRGSTSYGREFAEALRGRWGSVEIDDLLAVVDDLVARDWADPDRLFATGFSFGAIATAFLVGQTNRFAGAVAEHGVYDLRSDFGSSDYQAWTSVEFGLPWENPEQYEASSAITNVGNVDTPTLITAGGEDWRCAPTQSEQLYVSLKRAGVPTKLLIYPDEEHGKRSPTGTIHRLQAITSWFKKYDPTEESEE